MPRMSGKREIYKNQRHEDAPYDKLDTILETKQELIKERNKEKGCYS